MENNQINYKKMGGGGYNYTECIILFNNESSLQLN
jgi:hypothetical protein